MLSLSFATLVFLMSLVSGTSQTPHDCWRPPVDAPIVDPFRRPACPWCPGNRGIKFGTVGGETVHAVAGGTVAFAGSVAGTNYVVVQHVDGLKATYGRLDDIAVRQGSPVVARMGLGHAATRFHFGLRDGEEYLDPAPYLGEPSWRARLVPLDGAPPRPHPEPKWSCPSGTGAPLNPA